MSYSAPVNRLLFDLEHIGGVYRSANLDSDMLRQVLEEAGRFASGTLAPLNHSGDIEGAKFNNGNVATPKGFREAYKAWADAGWNSPDVPVELGGMGLPVSVSVTLMEFWTSACMGFSLGPVLTQGALDTIHAHGSRDLAERYVPKLVSGAWMATMNLTEPGAGSDLGALRTRAVPQSDGSYRITGSKIFITYGEHDLTDNIVHLVLARLPDAPAGTRGISLFVVPKFLVNPDGTLGAANDLRCAGIEKKAGIKAAPACTMSFGDNGGAVGWLIGQENRGLAAMFTMMNKARLFTAVQGVAIGERATQRALAYARERRQGSAPGYQDQAPIIAHPAVRRLMMSMRALTSASRALILAAGSAIDDGIAEGVGPNREFYDARAAMLTPLAKAFCSDAGVEIASLGVQVHGGMGYIEETGAIQHWRDARIVPIYEGTNEIQAIDLVQRKLPLLGGRVIVSMIADLRQDCGAAPATGLPSGSASRLQAATDALETATATINAAQGEEKLALATPYLELAATVLAAGFMARGLARGAAAGQGDTAAYLAAREDFAFYVDNILPRSAGLMQMIEAGGGATLDPRWID